MRSAAPGEAVGRGSDGYNGHGQDGLTGPMEAKEVLDELKTILVDRLRFDSRRAAETGLETTLPKGVDGSLGLDSLDFIELSIAIEERFGIVMDESQDLSAHFRSFETLCRFIARKAEAA